MARIVKRTRGGPYPVTIGGETKYICAAGYRTPSLFATAPTRFLARKSPTSSIGTTSKAPASKPLTFSRVFAVHKSETGSHDARSGLSACRLETTHASVVIAIVVLTIRKAARGSYCTPRRRAWAVDHRPCPQQGTGRLNSPRSRASGSAQCGSRDRRREPLRHLM